MSFNELTIVKVHKGLKEKKFSATELIKAVLTQIEKVDKKIHAYLYVAKEYALDQAKKIDNKIKHNKEIDILEGIPIAVKDNILVEDMPCTSGSNILKNYIAPYDAFVIKKIKQKGAIIIGKTNMDEFAMGSSTETSYFGPTRNPYDLERVPGGSSGGSAAAVVSNQCIAALGSDTGGSIRQPAGFCNVVGLKPTYGRVSRYGLMAMASSLDQIGPLTKTVEDAEILLKAIEGKDEMDSTSVDFKKMKIKTKMKKNKNLKIGIPKECFIKGLDKEVDFAIKKVIERFKDLGIKICEISLPYSEYALPCYYIIMASEVSANLARYDGIKYALSVEGKDLIDGYFKTRRKGFGKEVKRRIILGTYCLSAGYYDAYYLKAQKVRTLIKNDFEKAFKKVDLIITPTSPTFPFKIGERIKDPVKMYLSDIYTVSVNLAGVPAISIPSKDTNTDLPIGFQIIGPHFSEDLIFKVGKLYESSYL